MRNNKDNQKELIKIERLEDNTLRTTCNFDGVFEKDSCDGYSYLHELLDGILAVLYKSKGIGILNPDGKCQYNKCTLLLSNTNNLEKRE